MRPLPGTRTGGSGKFKVGPGSPSGGLSTDLYLTYVNDLLIPSLNTRSPASMASSISVFLMLEAWSERMNFTIWSSSAPSFGGVSRSMKAFDSVLTLFRAELINTLNL